MKKEHLPGLAKRTIEKTSSVLDRFENEMNPNRLSVIDERMLSHYVKSLRSGVNSKKLTESTIQSHLAHLKALLNWAKDQRIINEAPIFPKIKRSRNTRGQKIMKGRPITLEEFERMLEVVPQVVGEALLSIGDLPSKSVVQRASFIRVARVLLGPTGQTTSNDVGTLYDDENTM